MRKAATIISILSVGIFLNLMSCKDDEINILTVEQNDAIADQSLTEAYVNEAGDLSTMAFNSPTADQIKSGRTNGTITITVDGDTRFNGAVITLATEPNNNPLIPRGTITIDFGDGQTDPHGILRKGKIIVVYQGLRFAPGSTTTTTFDGYYVNGIKIEGTRNLTSTALTLVPTVSVTFGIKDSGIKAIFPDQTIITRSALHTHTITLGSTIGSTTWEVTGQASGITRAGYDYVSVIDRPFIFRTECAFRGFVLPAEGEMIFTISATPIVINFGDDGAECDNMVSVSINNKSQNISVGN